MDKPPDAPRYSVLPLDNRRSEDTSGRSERCFHRDERAPKRERLFGVMDADEGEMPQAAISRLPATHSACGPLLEEGIG